MGGNRPKWNEYFMNMLESVKARSTCLRRQVAAIIVDKRHRIISTGYNGSPQNLKHCLDCGCLREKEKIPSGEKLEYCRALHAEQNAILWAKQDLTDCTMYISFSPCVTCAKMIVASGISRVFYRGDYPANQLAIDILKEAEVEVTKL
jgi:dCMP deaminase